MDRQHSSGLVAVVALSAWLYGCRSARIDTPTEPLEPTVTVGVLPQRHPSDKEPAWYQDLMTTAPAAPTSQEKKKAEPKDRPWVPLDTPTEPPKPANQPRPSMVPTTTPESARADAQVLVDELKEKIAGERKKDAVWDLLRLELQSTGSEQGKVLAVLADVGLTSLYVPRPEILFEQVRFEDCMNRLARMAGMRYAQSGRWGNPVVTWRGEKVSVYDAVQAITAQHGFATRFAGAGTRFTFLLSKYNTKEQFISEVGHAIVECGQKMEKGMPTLLISLGTAGSKDTSAAAKKKETKDEPKDVKE